LTHHRTRKDLELLLLRLQLMADEIEKRAKANPNDAEYQRAATEARGAHTRMASALMEMKTCETNVKTARHSLDRAYLQSSADLDRSIGWVHSRVGLYNGKELRDLWAPRRRSPPQAGRQVLCRHRAPGRAPVDARKDQAGQDQAARRLSEG
jgi:hypothetical protein